MSDWTHKDIWKRPGRRFLIEISRHSVDVYEGEGAHRWAVYAYIYPKHPHYANFSGDEMWQDAASAMPCHSYPSYFRRHKIDGKVTSIQVGWDYNHLHDDQYTHMATADDAGSIFYDANRLFDWLEAINEETEAAA